MRKIKFRARNARTPSCWIYGYFVVNRGSHYIINDDGQFQVICDTEGQFTGLHDKNGTEIYAGDIVKRRDGGKYVIEYNRCCFFCRGIADKAWIHKDFSDGYEDMDEQPEVIGNIYENFELLKGEGDASLYSKRE